MGMTCNAKTLRILSLVLMVGPSYATCGCQHARTPRHDDRQIVRRGAAVLVSEARAVGTVPKVSRVAFPLRNDSEYPWTVSLESVSCACSDVEWCGAVVKRGERWSLGPHESAYVTIATRISPSVGEQSADVLLSMSGVAMKRSVILRAVTPVVADLQLQPPLISHDFVSARVESVESIVRITHHSRAAAQNSPRVEILGLPTNIRVLRVARIGGPVEIDERLFRDTWEAHLLVQPPRRTQHGDRFVRGEVTVGQGGTVAPLPVLVRRCFGLSAPTAIHFGLVKDNVACRRRFLISSAGEKKFQIRGVQCKEPAFSVEAEINVPKSGHWLEVVFTPCGKTAYSSELVIQTDCPGFETLRVLVRGALFSA